MNAFEDFVTEIREFYDLDTVFPKSVGQAYAEAAADLAQLRAAVGRLEGERQAAMQLVTLWRTEGEKRHDAQGPAYTMLSTLAGCAEALAAALAADGERGTSETDRLINRGVCPSCTWRGDTELENGVCPQCGTNWVALQNSTAP
jgi:hypothetical protein